MAPVFSELEARTLASVLDQIIPPSEDGKLPGAGELGLLLWGGVPFRPIGAANAEWAGGGFNTNQLTITHKGIPACVH